MLIWFNPVNPTGIESMAILLQLNEDHLINPWKAS